MPRGLAIWEVLAPVQDQIYGLVFTLLAVFVLWLFRSKVKLVYGRANNSINHVTLPNPDDEANPNTLEIYTEKFFLQNVGRSPATDVEFVLGDWPSDVNVWQPRDVEFKNISKGNCLIRIPRVAPHELVIIDCVYLNKRAAQVTSVKCAEAMGREVAFATNKAMPPWFNWTASVLFILGIAFVVQLLIVFLGS
jgi:hypothetical protein